jgi:hypothetical protein
MGDYQLAATELALLHDKAGRGVLSPDAFRQRQHDLLGLMYVARRAFLRRHDDPPGAPWAPDGRSGFANDPVQPTPLPPQAAGLA